MEPGYGLHVFLFIKRTFTKDPCRYEYLEGLQKCYIGLKEL